MQPKAKLPFIGMWTGIAIGFTGVVLLWQSNCHNLILVGSKGTSTGIEILVMIAGYILYHACYTIAKPYAIPPQKTK